ncbi:hypothetical protein BpHYR1_007825 [Brachionus plicatilis]|uniref:Uncharacterized protein n=1 Tax=Brachionus plicatilis TaxID=10195 RepID=A0A3M7T4J1_BRAPC|nr:hypothetical protein BpHYR1_007825 [Brachionus plicatilis]
MFHVVSLSKGLFLAKKFPIENFRIFKFGYSHENNRNNSKKSINSLNGNLLNTKYSIYLKHLKYFLTIFDEASINDNKNNIELSKSSLFLASIENKFLVIGLDEVDDKSEF